MGNSFFTIITVCKNEEKRILGTINSLKNQTFKDYEHIIIDGNSTDNTMEIIDNWSKENKNIKVCSENDTGIYNAMNKGIELAKGKYLFFLNAGDTFADNNVLQNVYGELLDETVDVWVGAFYLKHHTYIEKVYPLKVEDSIPKGRGYVHQAVFAKRSTLMDGFDENYSIHADLEWECRSYKKGYAFKTSNVLVSIFDINGVSGQAATLRKRLEEQDSIWKKYYINVYHDRMERRKQDLEQEQMNIKMKAMRDLFYLVVNDKKILTVFDKGNQTKIGIYGYGYLGQCLREVLCTEGIKDIYLIDNYIEENDSIGKIYRLNDKLPEMDLVIVTTMHIYKEVRDELTNVYKGKIASLEAIINELYEFD